MRVCLPVCLSIVAALAGCGPLTFTLGAGAPDRELQTEVVETERGAHASIALVDIDGVLLNATPPSLLNPADNPVALLDEKLRVAADDDRVRAVILRLNTPGGGVTASDLMYRQVRRFRAETGKPVVALMMDVCASGGTYLACAADRIVAHPTTVTGSIGVLVQTVSVKPALERWGVQPEAITSGPNKDIASPLGELTPEHRALLQGIVDSYYQRFVDVVRDSRGMRVDANLEQLTDGRVITGQQAHDWGLVDEVGDLRVALQLAKREAGLKRADVVMFRRPLRYIGSPYATARAESPEPRAEQSPLSAIPGGRALDRWFESTGGFYYLWTGPGF